jgi:hypothetical protein
MVDGLEPALSLAIDPLFPSGILIDTLATSDFRKADTLPSRAAGIDPTAMGPLTERTPGVQPVPREQVFMPQRRYSTNGALDRLRRDTAAPIESLRRLSMAVAINPCGYRRSGARARPSPRRQTV